MTTAIDSQIRSNLTTELMIVVGMIANQARRNASWSSSIPGAIEVGKVNVTGKGNISIQMLVDLNKAPEARAFEYGSGIHSTRGSPSLYIIRPKEAGALLIPYNKWTPIIIPYGSKKFLGETDKGYAFRYVEHPGVAAKPYIRPAINDNRQLLRERLTKAFKGAYGKVYARVTVIR